MDLQAILSVSMKCLILSVTDVTEFRVYDVEATIAST